MHSVHTLAAWVVNRCAACTWLVRAVRCVHTAGTRGALATHRARALAAAGSHRRGEARDHRVIRGAWRARL